MKDDTLREIGDIVSPPPKPNIEIRWGESLGYILIRLTVRKTIPNKIKYWLLCQFFPFKITKWEELK